MEKRRGEAENFQGTHLVGGQGICRPKVWLWFWFDFLSGFVLEKVICENGLKEGLKD